MNNNYQTESMKLKSGSDYCSIDIELSGQPSVNNYKCNSHKFSSSDMWKIEKRRKEFTRRTSIFAIN